MYRVENHCVISVYEVCIFFTIIEAQNLKSRIHCIMISSLWCGNTNF